MKISGALPIGSPALFLFPAEGAAADGAFVEVPEFEVGAFFVDELQGGEFFEAGVATEDFADDFEVRDVVGGDVDVAAGFEGVVEGVEEDGVEEAVFGVLLFRPRVGVEDVIGVDGGGGDEECGGVVAFHAEEADVLVAAAADSVVDLPDAFEHAVDAEEVDFGMIFCARHQEASLAAAEVDFDGLLFGKLSGEFHRAEPVVGVNAGAGLDGFHSGRLE